MPAACLLIVFLFGAEVRVLEMPDSETCEMLARSIASTANVAGMDGAACFAMRLTG